jgi:flagellar biosynthesis/type III secretory pathway protein FliH
MSEAVLAIPLARLFGAPLVPAGPTAAEREQAALDAGRAQGRAAAEAELLPRRTRLEAELGAARATHAEPVAAQADLAAVMVSALEARFADAVAVLGLAVARHVLAAEPGTTVETVRALVAEALSGLPAGEGGTVRLSPADMALAPLLPGGWRLEADDSLTAGTVVAEQGAALSGAGLALRFDRGRAALEAGQ